MIDEEFTRECADVYCIAYDQAFRRSRIEALSIQAAAFVTQAHFTTFGRIEEKKIQAAEKTAEKRARIKILEDMKAQYEQLKEHTVEESKKEKAKKEPGKPIC